MELGPQNSLAGRIAAWRFSEKTLFWDQCIRRRREFWLSQRPASNRCEMLDMGARAAALNSQNTN